MPGLLCADDLALCDKMEVDLYLMLKHFVEVYKGRGLKVNSYKSKDGVRKGGGLCN